MRRIVPEDLLRWKLEEDLGVDSQLESLDGDLLPVWELGHKCNIPRLEDTHGKGCDRIIRLDTARVRIGNGDTIVGPANVGDDCGQEETRIIILEELRSLAMEKGIEPALVNREIVGLRKTVVCGVLDQSARAVPF